MAGLLVACTSLTVGAAPEPRLQRIEVSSSGSTLTVSGTVLGLVQSEGTLSVDVLVRVVCTDGSGMDWGVSMDATLSGANRQEVGVSLPLFCQIASAQILETSVTVT
jgi:hypothetical protein